MTTAHDVIRTLRWSRSAVGSSSGQMAVILSLMPFPRCVFVVAENSFSSLHFANSYFLLFFLIIWFFLLLRFNFSYIRRFFSFPTFVDFLNSCSLDKMVRHGDLSLVWLSDIRIIIIFIIITFHGTFTSPLLFPNA